MPECFLWCVRALCAGRRQQRRPCIVSLTKTQRTHQHIIITHYKWLQHICIHTISAMHPPNQPPRSSRRHDKVSYLPVILLLLSGLLTTILSWYYLHTYLYVYNLLLAPLKLSCRSQKAISWNVYLYVKYAFGNREARFSSVIFLYAVVWANSGISYDMPIPQSITNLDKEIVNNLPLNRLVYQKLHSLWLSVSQ